MRHLPLRAVSLIVQIFNAMLHTNSVEAFPSDLHPYTGEGCGTTLILLAKLFLKILLNRILNEVSELGLVRGGQFRFRPRQALWPE